MKSLLQPLAFAVTGGLVVAGTFLALGVTGKRSTQTVVEESPARKHPVLDELVDPRRGGGKGDDACSADG